VSGRILVNNLSVIYNTTDPVVAIEGLNMEIADGECVSIVGPSGCGKSTLLNAIAGFIEPTSGDILLDGEKVTAPGPQLGVVFQNYELFPWKTVFQNIEFGLKMKGMIKEARALAVAEYIDRVGLEGFADRYPSDLSAGMAQRVGLARVLINQPKAVLLDEPFASLDAQTRLEMQEWVMTMWATSEITVLNVTHNIEEAIRLSDRVIIMTALPGKIRTIITIPFERPRPYSITGSTEFIKTRMTIYELIREEATRQRLHITEPAL
jgi:NitT/TauT family transport system ATP-binding protein